jgi:hypothetical protein
MFWFVWLLQISLWCDLVLFYLAHPICIPVNCSMFLLGNNNWHYLKSWTETDFLWWIWSSLRYSTSVVIIDLGGWVDLLCVWIIRSQRTQVLATNRQFIIIDYTATFDMHAMILLAPYKLYSVENIVINFVILLLVAMYIVHPGITFRSTKNCKLLCQVLLSDWNPKWSDSLGLCSSGSVLLWPGMHQ